MKAKTIGFIGGGRITHIFLKALSDSTLPPDRVTVSDSRPEALAKLQSGFPGISVSSDNRQSIAKDLVFVALHPPAIQAVLPEIKDHLPSQSVVVSLAPVISFRKLSDLLGGFQRMVRLIPNAPSIVHAGYNPVAFSPAISADERAEIEAILRPLGQNPVVAEETLEAYAILAAMGPTYFWFQWQALREMAASFGLGSTDADDALIHMLQGAITTLFHSNLGYEAVCDLIPVKPLSGQEAQIREIFQTNLSALHARLKGK